MREKKAGGLEEKIGNVERAEMQSGQSKYILIPWSNLDKLGNERRSRIAGLAEARYL
ncbi:MAG: hypothetical protein LBT59_29300 [Clostridiales bacterium]|nr:hypothetical protein [Clostridiales bacterium]